MFFLHISKDEHPRNSADVSLKFLTEDKYLVGLKQNQANKYFRLKMPKGVCMSSIPLWTPWLWKIAVKFNVKQSHVTETQLRYALVSKSSGFQAQQVLCLLCTTEGENPNMIHHFPFWTCTFKHFQQPVQEAIKELMRSLHMAFGCCGHCVPHRPQSCCTPLLNDICPLAGQPTSQHLGAGQPVVSVVVGTKGWQKGTIHGAPWQIVRHSMGSRHRPLLPVSSWRERVEGRVFSHQLLSFLNYGWRNSAKKRAFCQCSCPQIVWTFPSCLADAEQAACCA